MPLGIIIPDSSRSVRSAHLHRHTTFSQIYSIAVPQPLQHDGNTEEDNFCVSRKHRFKSVISACKNHPASAFDQDRSGAAALFR
jgi:hypothetical protein